MSKQRVPLLYCAVLLAVGSGILRAQQGPAVNEAVEHLLKLAASEEPSPARASLRKAVLLLKKGTVQDRQELAKKLTDLLSRVAQTPSEVSEVLGPPEQVARQVLYRRYREQWSYETPVPVLVIFDVAAGDGPKILTVRPATVVLP
jgi:hypothetical protein